MRAILICPSAELKEKFTAAAAQHPSIVITKVLDAYPSRENLRRVVCATVPEIVFLDIEDALAAEVVARQLEKDYPTIQRIALHRTQDTLVFRRALQLRMRELLAPPFDPIETELIFRGLHEELIAHPATVGASKHLFAFLPAKPGSGASTVAANASWAFGQIPENKTLLADFDTSSGVLGFMFKVEHDYTLKDAAAHEREFDDETWNRMVRKVGNIDLLLSGAPHIGETISSRQLTRLIEFSRRNYDTISVDLPDTLNEISLALLRESNQIFLVTTPELPALRMARLKAALLQKLELHDKVSIILNRAATRMELSVKEIEETVGLPVFTSFPCDYANVSGAIRTGQPASKLCGAAQDFAGKLLNVTKQKRERKRFIETFAVVPARYGFR
jgi:pilus assembly protein CpaE